MRVCLSKNNTQVAGLLLAAASAVPMTAQAVALSVNPANPLEVPFSTFVYSGGAWVGDSQFLDLDINNDGVDDVSFSNGSYTASSYASGYYDPNDPYSYYSMQDYSLQYLQTITSTGVVNNFVYLPGETVMTDPGAYGTQAIVDDYSASSEYCDYWTCDYFDDMYQMGLFIDWGVNQGILGFTFMIGADEHFGWVEVANGGGLLSVLGWGWETEANTAIAAGYGSPVPVPPAAALLLSGLLGVFGIARRKSP